MRWHHDDVGISQENRANFHQSFLVLSPIRMDEQSGYPMGQSQIGDIEGVPGGISDQKVVGSSQASHKYPHLSLTVSWQVNASYTPVRK